MSSLSTPTKPYHFFDVPEVENLASEFNYNFFMADETINESGNDGVDGSLSKRFLNKGTADLGNLNARVPRYVKLTWSVKDTPKKTMGKRSSSLQGQNVTSRFLEWLAKQGLIFTETLASGKDHDSYLFFNEQIPDVLNNMWNTRFSALGLEEASREEMLQEIAKSSGVDNDILEDMLPPLNRRNKPKGNYLAEEKKIWAAGSLNTSYAPMLLRSHIDRANDLQLFDSVEKFNTGLINWKSDDRCHVSNSEYVFDVPFAHPLQLASDSNFVGEAVIVGYVLEKWREYGGKKYEMPAVIVAGENIRTAYDSEVAYGQTYLYSARTVSKIRVPITDYETGKTYIGTFYLASRPSAVIRKTCLEDRDPPWPPDINFYYDFANDSLRLVWAPPVNSQRDIKYLQIFRRKTIEEPFTLIKQFNFNDSVIVTRLKEQVESTLVEVIETDDSGIRPMPTTWVDSDFTKESSYIYAIAVIDARQNSSAYSAQTLVTFDTTKNKIHKEMISYGGAPKQYPNWYLKTNFFDDCIKDSMHEKLQIFFDPECKTISMPSGAKERAFFTKQNDEFAKYVFQFINTDRLLESTITVRFDESTGQKKTNKEQRAARLLSRAIDKTGNFL